MKLTKRDFERLRLLALGTDEGYDACFKGTSWGKRNLWVSWELIELNGLYKGRIYRLTALGRAIAKKG